MKTYHELEKELLSKLYDAKVNNTELKEVQHDIINPLIISNGADMVEVLKDLNNKGFTHITFANGQGDYFFTRANEDYITLKGREYFEKFVNT